MKGVIPQGGTLQRQLYEQGLCDGEKGQDQSTRKRMASDRGIHCDRKGAEDVGLDTSSRVQLRVGTLENQMFAESPAWLGGV